MILMPGYFWVREMIRSRVAEREFPKYLEFFSAASFKFLFPSKPHLHLVPDPFFLMIIVMMRIVKSSLGELMTL